MMMDQLILCEISSEQRFIKWFVTYHVHFSYSVLLFTALLKHSYVNSNYTVHLLNSIILDLLTILKILSIFKTKERNGGIFYDKS